MVLIKAKERGELRRDLDLLAIAEHFHWLYLLLISAWLNGKVWVEEAETTLEILFRQAMEGLQPQISGSPSPRKNLQYSALWPDFTTFRNR